MDGSIQHSIVYITFIIKGIVPRTSTSKAFKRIWCCFMPKHRTTVRTCSTKIVSFQCEFFTSLLNWQICSVTYALSVSIQKQNVDCRAPPRFAFPVSVQPTHQNAARQGLALPQFEPWFWYAFISFRASYIGLTNTGFVSFLDLIL